MIVKTGANYQNEGGYIEFAANNPNGSTIINGREVPTQLYETVVGITGYGVIRVKKTPESAGAISVIQFQELTSLEGVKYRDYNFHTVYTTDTYMAVPIDVGATISVPSGMKPILADGSEDVRIIRSTSAYFLKITGKNPVAVLSYTEA